MTFKYVRTHRHQGSFIDWSEKYFAATSNGEWIKSSQGGDEPSFFAS
jgi:hypothetical protein